MVHHLITLTIPTIMVLVGTLMTAHGQVAKERAETLERRIPVPVQESERIPFPDIVFPPIRRMCPRFDYDAFYDLEHNNVYDNSKFVSVVGSLSGKGCSTRGVLKLALASSLEDPARRRVLVDLFFDTPTGWVFNLGDSNTNNGYAGDASTSSNDGEVQGTYNTMRGYLSDVGGSGPAFAAPSLYSTRLTLLAGDGHLVWLPNNNNNFNYYFNPALFALNGQADPQGAVNYDLFLGMNKVIYGNYRVGSGLCKVGIKFLPEF